MSSHNKSKDEVDRILGTEEFLSSFKGGKQLSKILLLMLFREPKICLVSLSSLNLMKPLMFKFRVLLLSRSAFLSSYSKMSWFCWDGSEGLQDLTILERSIIPPDSCSTGSSITEGSFSFLFFFGGSS
jgi:hypothetical protein